ncbi:hypothetical protein [Schlesneria paludicola]|uniref:hypothetical protein n=1 Tax=Schlesneria paludicola TaxID=360056 RepID=UPI0012F925D9|nr:hypothetical protein [Schlesneria paludicola]
MFVVSANYRDRSSPYRWLIRKSDEPAENAKAYKRVELEEVTFERSNQNEEGYGCRTVAFADKAIGFEPEEVAENRAVNLRFDGEEFRDESNLVVKSCTTLKLGKFGDMVAVV